MKEIILKFLETQNFSTILAELAVLFTAWQSWKKYKENNKKEHKNNFLKALNGTGNINEILSELQSSFEGNNVIPAVLEITNGGGVPQEDKPLYLRAINSTNNEILQLWGNKSLVVAEMAKAISRLVISGSSSLLMDKFELKKVDFWAGAKSITRVHYFVVGWRSKCLTILAINTEKPEDLTDQELLIAYTFASRIKKEFNSNKKFWQNKMT